MPHYFSPNPAVDETIQWLIANGCPALPIAPYQPPERYPMTLRQPKGGEQGPFCPVDRGGRPIPRFTGKNPSYLDGMGQPRLLPYRCYHHRLPTPEELRVWFAHPHTGVATLGGWNSTVWLDIDAKRFASINACEQVVSAYLEFIPELKRSVIERTQGGGWRIGVRCQRLPDFTRMAFLPQGGHIGELMGKDANIVLAPTQGTKGVYRSINRGEFLWVEAMAAISIYPFTPTPRPRRQTVRYQRRHRPTPSPLGYSFSFWLLASRKVQQLNLDAVPPGERSDAMTLVAREIFGWENWLSDHGMALKEDAELLCFQVGERLGLDSGRVARILDSTSGSRSVRDSTPSAYYAGGDAACHQRVQWLVIRR